MTSSIRFLMCAPHHYEVDYVINPWMEGNIHRSSIETAQEQWQDLYQIIADRANVDLVKPQQGWPDMVFTANAGLILGNQVVLSRFLHPERQGEEPFFKAWFEEQGHEVFTLPPDLPFEGAGDALLDREGRWLWAGYGFRTELDSHGICGQVAEYRSAVPAPDGRALLPSRYLFLPLGGRLSAVLSAGL
jgi:N-dimethylarginine dimethylaminohydrolase